MHKILALNFKQYRRASTPVDIFEPGFRSVFGNRSRKKYRVIVLTSPALINLGSPWKLDSSEIFLCPLSVTDTV